MFLHSEHDCDIIQIAAWTGTNSFMEYVQPTKPINATASEVNKIVMIGDRMFHDGTEVEYISRKKAFREFARFIERIDSDVVLVAHNGKNFDFQRSL